MGAQKAMVGARTRQLKWGMHPKPALLKAKTLLHKTKYNKKQQGRTYTWFLASSSSGRSFLGKAESGGVQESPNIRDLA